MAMRRILGGGGSIQEMLSIRFKAEGKEEVKRAQAALKETEKEISELNEAFERGAVHSETYKERLKELTKELNGHTRAVEKATQQEKIRASGLFYLARAARAAATGGSPMTVANNVFFAARSAGGVGGLAKDMARLATSGPAALAGLAAAAPAATTAIIATGGALVALHKGLKEAELGWGDLTTVAKNTSPWKSAQKNIEETWTVLSTSDAGIAIGHVWDGLQGVAHDIANLALGWDAATDAARRHNWAIEEAAKEAERLADEAKRYEEIRASYNKFTSGATQAGEARGNEFAQAMADAAGHGDIKKMLDDMAEGVHGEWRDADRRQLDDWMERAMSGDRSAAYMLAQRAERKGFDARGMHGAMEDGVADLAGPGRRELEEGLAERKEMDRLRAEADKALSEARKVSVEAAFEGIVGLGSRVDAGLRNRLGENLEAGFDPATARAMAGGGVAESLARELQESGGLPEQWAKEEAERYVKERGRALRNAAAGDAAAFDPDAQRLEEIGLIRQQAGLAEMLSGGQVGPGAPGIFSADSFASAVQSAGAKSPSDLLEDQLRIEEATLKLQQDIKRILERGGLLGA